LRLWEYFEAEKRILYVCERRSENVSEVGYYSLSERCFSPLYTIPFLSFGGHFDPLRGILYSTCYHKNIFEILNLETLAFSHHKTPKIAINSCQFDDSKIFIQAKNGSYHLYSNDMMELFDSIESCNSAEKIGNTNTIFVKKLNSEKIAKFLIYDAESHKFHEQKGFSVYGGMCNSYSDYFFYEKDGEIIKVQIPSFNEEVAFSLKSKIPSGYSYRFQPLTEKLFWLSVYSDTKHGIHVLRHEVIDTSTFETINVIEESGKLTQANLWHLTNLYGVKRVGDRIIEESIALNFLTGEVSTMNFWHDYREYLGLPKME